MSTIAEPNPTANGSAHFGSFIFATPTEELYTKQGSEKTLLENLWNSKFYFFLREFNEVGISYTKMRYVVEAFFPITLSVFGNARNCLRLVENTIGIL